MNVIGFFDSLGRELRYTLRGLPRRPTFTLAVVVYGDGDRGGHSMHLISACFTME